MRCKVNKNLLEEVETFDCHSLKDRGTIMKIEQETHCVKFDFYQTQRFGNRVSMVL